MKRPRTMLDPCTACMAPAMGEAVPFVPETPWPGKPPDGPFRAIRQMRNCHMCFNGGGDGGGEDEGLLGGPSACQESRGPLRRPLIRTYRFM